MSLVMLLVLLAALLALLLPGAWFAARGRSATRAAAPMGPPGWYADPAGSGRRRRFDGRAWTDEYLEAAGTTQRRAA